MFHTALCLISPLLEVCQRKRRFGSLHFFGALAFALILYVFLQRALNWYNAAPFVALLSFCNSYVVHYSQEARGYSWMLAFQVLLLAIAYRLSRQPLSIAWGAAMTLIAVLSFMNLINLALDWLIPVYLVLWIFPPVDNPSQYRISGRRRQWHRNLLVQLLCVGSIVLIFLVERLPYVYSSARQYGTPLRTQSEFLTQCSGIVHYLFPSTAWVLFAGLGTVGIGALTWSRRFRFLGFLSIVTILISVMHSLLTKKLPYARTCGYFLPLVLFGAAYLIERFILLRASILYRSFAFCLVAVLAGILIWQSLRQGPAPDAFAVDMRACRLANAEKEKSFVYAVLPPRVDYQMSKYLPMNWCTSEDNVFSDGSINRVAFLVKASNPLTMEVQFGCDEMLKTLTLPCLGHAATAAVGPYRLVQWDVRTEPFASSRPYPGKSPILILWYPDTQRLGLSGEDVIKLLQSAQIPYLRRNHRFPTKLDFYSQLYALEFMANCETEWTKIVNTIKRGQSRFGGHALFLVPVK